MSKYIYILFLLCFSLTTAIGEEPVYAQDLILPAPGTMVRLSEQFDPPILRGIKIHTDNPLKFDFILDRGNDWLSRNQIKAESAKLIKYFLAGLTMPEKDLWVNLSPYEQDRIIPQSFGLTEMGRDLLAEDYLLKQVTASLIYPEDLLGKEFWKRVYEEARKKYGTTNIQINTFNKVWVVPEKSIVYEDRKTQTVYVVQSTLKVMLEQDYLALTKNNAVLNQGNDIGSKVVREIVIPQLTKEVNEGRNFLRLRQVYNSLILATWYKNKVTDSVFSKIYVNKSKIFGVNTNDPNEKQKIYAQYLQAFKKGVYNYVKEDKGIDESTATPRKYFSGGLVLNINVQEAIDVAMLSKFADLFRGLVDRLFDVRVDIKPVYVKPVGDSGIVKYPIIKKKKAPKEVTWEAIKTLMDSFKNIEYEDEAVKALRKISRLREVRPEIVKFITRLIKERIDADDIEDDQVLNEAINIAIKKEIADASVQMVKLLNDTSEDIGQEEEAYIYLKIAKFIIMFGNEETRRKLVTAVRKTKSEALRLMYLKLFEDQEQIAPELFNLIYLSVKDKYRFARRLAIQLLKKINTCTSRDILINALRDADGIVVDSAVESLDRIGDQDTIALLREAVSKQPKRRTLFIFDDHSTEVAYTRNVEIEGYSAGNFLFSEKVRNDNPLILRLQHLIIAIDQRLTMQRFNKTLDISTSKDIRLLAFFDFLKKNSLADNIVVIGGGVRDVLAGKQLGDIDISVAVPMSFAQRVAFAGTESLASEAVYNKALEGLTKLAVALGVSVEDFINPTNGKKVMFEGLDIQYAGPVKLRDETGEAVYIKRNLVDLNSRSIYSSSSGASLLQMGLDAWGHVYGRVEAIEAYKQGNVYLVGGLKNLSIGNILRLFRLKYQFNLNISQEDIVLVKQAIAGYLENSRPVESLQVRQATQQQLDKLLAIPDKKLLIKEEFDTLGITILLKDHFGIDFAQVVEHVPYNGGINFNKINESLETRHDGIVMQFKFDQAMLQQLEKAPGFIPVITNVQPIKEPLFATAPFYLEERKSLTH